MVHGAFEDLPASRGPVCGHENAHGCSTHASRSTMQVHYPAGPPHICWIDMAPMCSVVRMVPASTATTRSGTRGLGKCGSRVGIAVQEQDVMIHRPRAGPATHKADLTAVNSMGLRLAFDVTITGLPNQLRLPNSTPMAWRRQQPASQVVKDSTH
eukprot:4322964-Amphidinium_carterae.1